MLKRTDITEEELKIAEEIIEDIKKKSTSYLVIKEVYRILTLEGVTPAMPIFEDKDGKGNGFVAIGLF